MNDPTGVCDKGRTYDALAVSTISTERLKYFYLNNVRAGTEKAGGAGEVG